MTAESTIVHVLRHGEVFNPTGVLYGRLPGFHLSPLGVAMAERIGERLAGEDITYVVASPLDRAQETALPTATALGLTVATDGRLTESANVFEGKAIGVGDGSLRKPSQWVHLRNPLKPSWGEPYTEIAARMLAAIESARDAARGHEALVVSHQLPIWTLRCFVTGRRLWHDPRKRQCSLASLTSIVFHDDQLVAVTYTEPAKDLLPGGAGKPMFRAGA